MQDLKPVASIAERAVAAQEETNRLLGNLITEIQGQRKDIQELKNMFLGSTVCQL